MAQDQTTAGGSTGRAGGGTAGGGMGGGTTGVHSRTTTGVDNETYDLISVLYHALNSADVMQRYLKDAKGDQEAMQLFQKALENNRQFAMDAQNLLQKRLGQTK